MREVMRVVDGMSFWDYGKLGRILGRVVATAV